MENGTPPLLKNPSSLFHNLPCETEQPSSCFGRSEVRRDRWTGGGTPPAGSWFWFWFWSWAVMFLLVRESETDMEGRTVDDDPEITFVQSRSSSSEPQTETVICCQA